MSPPETVHNGIEDIHEVNGFFRSGVVEVTVGKDIDREKTDASNIEPPHHAMSMPIIGHILIKPGMEKAFERPKSDKYTQGTTQGEHRIEKKNSTFTRQIGKRSTTHSSVLKN